MGVVTCFAGDVAWTDDSSVVQFDAAVGHLDVLVVVLADTDDSAESGPTVRYGILDEDGLSHLKGGKGT